MPYDPQRPVMTVLWEDTGLILMARILGQDGAVVNAASISDIRCEVMDLIEQTLVVEIDVAPGDVIDDVLTADDERWSADSVGYNFLHEVPAIAFPEPGKTYQLSYLFTPLVGEPFPLVHHVQTKKLFA